MVSQQSQSVVSSFYLAYYGRPADPVGLAFWSMQLDNANGDFGAIVDAFAYSEEFLARVSTTNVEERVSRIYQEMFSRAPDQAGLDFWINAIDKGHATLADAAIAILHGAQSTDLELATARQRTADAFTAAVAANGTAYEGMAALQAGRLLLQSVSNTTSQADVDAMLQSALTLAATASAMPEVIDALAQSGDLTVLLDTARGGADPVGLLDTLANVAKVAAANPATLDSLLRGGGMEKVLTVMPNNVSLSDVVAALEKGGMDAAAGIVYPTAPTTPTTPPTPADPPAPTFRLAHDDGVVTISGTSKDGVIVNLTDNTILRRGAAVTVDGNPDLSDVVASRYTGKVTIIGTAAEVAQATRAGVDAYNIKDLRSNIFTDEAGGSVFAPGVEALLDGASAITLQGALSSQERDLLESLPNFDMQSLTVNNRPPTLATEIADQSATQGTAFSFTLADNVFTDADGDSLTYTATLANGDDLPAWLAFDGASRSFSGTPADGDVGPITVKVTAADNEGALAATTFTLNQTDSTAPATHAVTLIDGDDTGLLDDLTTNKSSVTLDVGGIEIGGRAWLDKDGNDEYDLGTDVLAVEGKIVDVGLAPGANPVRVVGEDASGNQSVTSVSVVRDSTAPERDANTPIQVRSTTDDSAYSEGDTITIMFGEAIDVSKIASGSMSIVNGHSLGDGYTILAVNAENGYARTFAITLGANPSVREADIVSFGNTGVVDLAGNQAQDDVSFTLPAIVDEIAPLFTSSTLGDADENQPTLYTAQATDGSAITYTLKEGADAEVLAIDAQTGVVSLRNGALDHETKSSYSFTVIANDGTNDTEQTVTVGVNNGDETAPVITSGATASVNENTGAGKVVYTATATDTGDISAGVTYGLKANNDDDAALFTIDALTGAVSLTVNPDYEDESNTDHAYSFTVLASDGINAAIEQNVTLSIADVDDTPPDAPTVTLASDTGTSGDRITSDARLSIGMLELGESLKYSFDGETWSSGYFAPQVDGEYTVHVKRIDGAGNASPSASLTFTLDTTKPEAASEDAVVTSIGAYGAGKIITLTMAEAVSVAGFVNGLAADSNHTLGGGYVVAAVDAADGYAKSFTLTLGTGTDLGVGDKLSVSMNSLTDIAGNDNFSIEFTLPDVVAPTFDADASGAGGNVVPGGSIVLKFDEAIAATTSDLDGVRLKDANDVVVGAAVSIDGDGNVVIAPTDPLVLGTAYHVTWDADALQDAAGNPVAAVADTSVAFTAAGPYTGTVAQVQALQDVQLAAATAIIVKDTAENLSNADFSELGAQTHAARTITLDADDFAVEGVLVVTVGASAPVNITLNAGTAANIAASALAAELNTRFSSSFFAVDEQNPHSVTVSSAFNGGEMPIEVTYNEVSVGSVFSSSSGGHQFAIMNSSVKQGREIAATALSTTAKVIIGAGMTANQAAEILMAQFTSAGFTASSSPLYDGSPYIALSYPGQTFSVSTTQSYVLPAAVIPDTGSMADGASTPKITTIILADGETGDAFLSVAELDGRTLVLDDSAGDAKFVVQDTAAELAKVFDPEADLPADLSHITGIGHYELKDSASAIFGNGDAVTLAWDLISPVSRVTVTDPLNVQQAHSLTDTVQGRALTYDIEDTAANLLQASTSLQAVIDAAGDVDVSELDVGNISYEQLVTLYSLIDGASTRDQQLIYTLTASATDLFDGNALTSVSEDYLENASSITVTGATIVATVTVDGRGGGAATAESQSIFITPANGGEYRLTVGNTTLRSDMLDSGATTAELFASLQQAAGYSGAAFALFLGDDGAINLVWKDSGIVLDVAQLTAVSSVNLAQATALVATTEALTYDLKLTASELVTAVQNVAKLALINGARDITITNAMTVAQASHLADINVTGNITYNITDTAAALAGGETVIDGARDLVATGSASAAQAEAIYQNRGNSGTVTYSVSDTTGNLVNGNTAALGAGVDIVSQGYWTTAGQAQALVNLTNSGYTEIRGNLRDGVAALNTFIDANGAGVENENVLRPYEYFVSDNAANITSAAADAGASISSTQHVLTNATQISVNTSMTYAQASTLVNTLDVAAQSLLTENKVGYVVSDTVANLGDARIWLEGSDLTNSVRATSYAQTLIVNDTADNIAKAQNGDGQIGSSDGAVFQRIDEMSDGGIVATASAGNQTIAGSQHSDNLDGGVGNDILYGNGGGDWLLGGDGNDSLYGGDGRDVLYAGSAGGTGTGTNYHSPSNFVHGGNGGDNMYGSGVTGTNDRDQFVYSGSTRAELIAESGTFTTNRDYINNIGYGDTIMFEGVDSDNVFFRGTSGVANSSVAAGTFAISISYDRNVMAANWDDTGTVQVTKVNIDIADAQGNFDGNADMTIIVVGTDVDLNWTGQALGFGA